MGENTTTGGAATGSSSTMDVEYLVPAREELEARIFFAAASALVGCDACGNELKAFLGQGIAGDEFTGASVEFYVKPRVQMIDEADLAGLTWKPGSAGTGGGSGAAGGGAADGPSMQGGGGGGGVVTNGGDSMVGMAVGVTVGVALAIVVAVLLFVTRWRSNDRKRRRAESLQNELAANRGLHSTGGDGTITNFWEEFAGGVENDGVAMVDQRGSGRGSGRGGGRGGGGARLSLEDLPPSYDYNDAARENQGAAVDIEDPVKKPTRKPDRNAPAMMKVPGTGGGRFCPPPSGRAGGTGAGGVGGGEGSRAPWSALEREARKGKNPFRANTTTVEGMDSDGHTVERTGSGAQHFTRMNPLNDGMEGVSVNVDGLNVVGGGYDSQDTKEEEGDAALDAARAAARLSL